MSKPALHVHKDGTQVWYLDDRLHRTDGPARIYPSGTQSWWQNGRRHREDGPALVRPDGHHEWWVNGQWLTQQEFELYRFRRWAVEGELI
jgi:hypothetical protein